MLIAVSTADRRWHVPSHRSMTTVVGRTMHAVHQSRVRGMLSIAFVGDAAMRHLNRTWRGKDRTTDVLSFAYQSTVAEIQGEIVISVPTARRQATIVGHSLRDELLFLVVHGVLHIAGYDHERSAREERRMNELQRRILKRSSSFI